MAELRRVAITGMGTVNASTVGGTAAIAEALASGSSRLAPVRAFPVDGLASGLAAEVDDATLAPLVGRDEGRRLSRICRIAVAAAGLAVRDARVTGGAGLGIAVGTEHGDFRSSEEFALGFLRRGPSGISPMIFPNTVMNTMASAAAIAVEAKGPSVTFNQATVAGDLAIARAAALVASGRAEAVVAGGVDEICELVYRRLAELRVLSPMRCGGSEGCRPYDRAHNGPVLGEGATFVVLEALDGAHARGATVIAEVVDAAWGGLSVRPHGARPAQRDRGSPVRRLFARQRDRGSAFAISYGSGNGDPDLDDWECALLASDLPESAGTPPLSLAPVFGQHGGLGALRVAAAALEAKRAGARALVHGIARGGCRTALVVAPVETVIAR